jgi:hypothetical protein
MPKLNMKILGYRFTILWIWIVLPIGSTVLLAWLINEVIGKMYKEECPPAVTVAMPVKAPTGTDNSILVGYWDGYAFTDTMNIHRPEVTMKAFAGYAELLSRIGREEAGTAIRGLLERTCEDSTGRMYNHFLGLLKEAFYNPISPLRDDELYIPVLEYALGDSTLAEIDRSHLFFDLSGMRLNRVDSISTDFAWQDIEGRKGRLSTAKGHYRLVYFNNPDCHACEEMTRRLAGDQVISGLVSSGYLSVLAVYPDRDQASWREHAGSFPPEWINPR